MILISIYAHPLVTTNFRLLESKIIDGKVWTLLVGTNRSIFSESLYGRFNDILGIIIIYSPMSDPSLKI